MNNYTGDDLLNTLETLNVDLRNLSPIVIQAWFDSDCNKDLLNWMCSSLSHINYISPLERAEFEELEVVLDTTKCEEELARLDPNYLTILDVDKNLDEILLIKEEIDYLEEENRNLDKFIKVYENLESNFSLDLTHKTEKGIKSKVECKKSHEACVELSTSLEEVNKKLRERLVHYDPEAHFVNFVDVKEYLENIDNLTTYFVLPLIEIDKSDLDYSENYFSDALETCKRRILHSHQIFLANKIEVEKLTKIQEFLNTTNINEIISSSPLNSQMTIKAKEHEKMRMCEVLDGMAAKLADYYLMQTRISYVKKDLEHHQQKSQNISNILDNLTKLLSYITLTNCLQLEEKKDVECITTFYQKMNKYVNDDLRRCDNRAIQMKKIIEEYKTYSSKPAYERSTLIKSIVQILSSNGNTFKAAWETVGKFKSELSFLESQFFSVDVHTEKEKTNKLNENIKILQDFLISGPTNRVVVVPIDLQNVWFKIEEHLKKESLSVGQAVAIPQTARKTQTKAQNYTRQLLMSFLTNPSNLDNIMKLAEEDFKKRTAQYF